MSQAILTGRAEKYILCKKMKKKNAKKDENRGCSTLLK